MVRITMPTPSIETLLWGERAIRDPLQGQNVTGSTHCMLGKRAASLLEAPEHRNLVAANPREKAWWKELSEAALSRPIP